MDEDAVDDLERGLRHVLVRAVDRVARLKADHALPAALGERRARLHRVERELREGGLLPLEDRDVAGQVLPRLAVQARHAGVRLLGGAEAELGLVAGVVGVDLADVEHGQERAVLGGQGHAVAARRLGDGQRHGQRPDGAVVEMHVLDDARVVGGSHEAAQRRERSAREHVQIGHLALAERDPLERRRRPPGARRCG